MKKAGILLLTLALALCLCACSGSLFSREYIFPEETILLGVDVSGTNRETAWSLLVSAASDYRLELTVDGLSISLSASDIGLACSEDAFTACVDAMEAGTDADVSGIVSFREDKLKALLQEQYTKKVEDAAIVFDEAAGAFILIPHAEGLKTDIDALTAAAGEAICILKPQHDLKGFSEVLVPAHTDDDPDSLAALELVNKMTGIQLSYDFTSGTSATAQLIPGEKLRSFVDLGEDGFTPTIVEEAVHAYAAELNEAYSIDSSTGSFHTTGGSTIDFSVTYEGLSVDTEAISQDIITCMQEGISETRQVPYLGSGILDMAYGGTYIEVNLSAQHLWFYKNGECIVSTDLVSGMVGAGMNTPTGVYSIYSKSTDTYLVGPDYRSYVNYWMPFSGGYGLHDATWRGSFGGEIYLYDGSHGCVNLPLSAASTIYNNAPVGTKVILYGGVRYVPPLDQKLTGTTAYDVADDADPFRLDIQASFAKPELSYTSDNPNVATVSEDGTVTIKGIGTAKIKIHAEPDSCYAEATASVTVSVHSACQDGRHVMGEPVTVTAPTCQPGLERTTCTKCDHYTEQALAAVNPHTYGQWITVTAPTCTQEGVQERTCTVCNSVKETGSVPATGVHTPGQWATTTAPSCTAEGTQTKSCTVCGTALETAPIAATGHSFDSGPSCTACGAANPDYTGE